MCIRVITGFLLLALAFASQAACPPRLGGAELQQAARLDQYFLRTYAISRLLACGFTEARTDLELALPLPGTDMSAFGTYDAAYIRSATQSGLSAFMLSLRPREFVVQFVREQRKQSASLRLSPADFAIAAKRLETDIPAIVALLRERLPADELEWVDTYLERVLIAHEVRTGQSAAALERLDSLDHDPRLKETAMPGEYAPNRQWVRDTRVALAETSPVGPPATDWVLNLTTTSGYQESCADPLTDQGCALLPAGLRADTLLRNGDQSGAIEVLLRNEWTRSQVYRVSCRQQLLPLLHERFTAEALRSGWLAAEAAIRVGGTDNGFQLYGVDLPLPRAALVHDTVAREFVERPLTREQATALMRGSDLYQALFETK